MMATAAFRGSNHLHSPKLSAGRQQIGFPTRACWQRLLALHRNRAPAFAPKKKIRYASDRQRDRFHLLLLVSQSALSQAPRQVARRLPTFLTCNHSAHWSFIDR
jgi:hypothetical protein